MLGTVRFDLRAVCPGRANLQLSVSYETLSGCPGMEFFRFTSDTSDVFPLDIEDPESFTLSGMVTEFPLCQGAQRGFTVTLEPLGLATQTDLSTGGFSFQVPPGDYTLSVSPPCNPFGCWPETPVTVVDQDIFVQICPEEQPTPTVTATSTETPNATPTATPTTPQAPTDTATPSATATGAVTPSAIATHTATATVTPTATETPRTPTATVTFSASATLTPTASPTQIETSTTPTATATPTSQPSASGGGGCSTTPSAPGSFDPSPWLALVAAVWLRRRRGTVLLRPEVS